MLKTKAHKVILSPLPQAQDIFQSDLKKVDQVIYDQISSSVPLTDQITSYIMEDPGKRLRPLLTLLAARLFNSASNPKAITLAACIEFIHTATLLHDDVIDQSLLRRGKQCANHVWGNEASILVGDFLFSRAFEMLVEMGSLPLLKILSKTITTMAEGELLQIMVQGDLNMKEETYLKIIQAKTAQLFSAACGGGGMVAEASEEEIQALESYGHNLGMLFQITDDLLDYSLESSGDDLREGKITLPVILAYRQASEKEKVFWRDLIKNKENIDQAVLLLRSQGIKNLTLEKAKIFQQNCVDSLGIFPDSTEKSLLVELVNFCLYRNA